MKMTPLPEPKGPAPKPYKGSLKVAADPVLSQAELNSRFQGAQAVQQTTRVVKKTDQPKGVMGKIVGNVTETIADIKDAGKGVYTSSIDNLKQRSEKADRQAQRKYEEKRQEEMKKERWELENRRRAERAIRKRQNL